MTWSVSWFSFPGGSSSASWLLLTTLKMKLGRLGMTATAYRFVSQVAKEDVNDRMARMLAMAVRTSGTTHKLDQHETSMFWLQPRVICGTPTAKLNRIAQAERCFAGFRRGGDESRHKISGTPSRREVMAMAKKRGIQVENCGRSASLRALTLTLVKVCTPLGTSWT